MASSGDGNRQGSGNRSGTGKRPNTSGSGNRKASSAGSSSAGAAERARQRVQQQQTAGGRPGGRAGSGGGSKRPTSASQARNARRQPQRGRSTAANAGIFGGVFVLLAVIVIILVSVVGGAGAGKGHDPYVKAHPDAAITNAVTHVPTSELAAAGNGPSTGADAISNVGKKGSGANIVAINSSLTSDGKPEVVYLGSEFCPYCAATRWPLTIALSRFGTFSGLEVTASSPLDAYESTNTLTYLHATYKSNYLTFNHTEELSNECPTKDVIANSSYSSSQPSYDEPKYVCNGEAYIPLQQPSAQVNNLVNTYDTVTYFGTLDDQGAGIPFIDFGGKYVESGAIYTPLVLYGSTWAQIVNSFKAPTQGIGQQVLASANRYTAILCNVTHDKPGSVCDASYMKSAEKALKS